MDRNAYRLILNYDIHPAHYEQYYRYMLGEFVPMMQQLGLRMLFAWHVYGDDYPQRQVEFIADTRQIMHEALNDTNYLDGQVQLETYTINLRRKVVRFERPFQF